jgi:uncharacterized membrane protein
VSLLKDLEELQTQGVITSDVAGRIRDYYEKPKSGASRMIIAFGIVGALLVGMGIVMILAHNWDDFSNPVKLTIGMMPLLAAQVICGWLVLRNITSAAWREAASLLLIFSVATAIAIVSQVYNMGGSMSSFLLTWMLLCVPIPYLMQSRIASLFCWVVITWYAFESGNIFSHTRAPVYYWVLVLLLAPYYIRQVQREPQSNNVSWHNWIIALSVAMTFSLNRFESDDLLAPAFVTLFSIFVLIGQLPVFANRRLMANGWLVVGSGSMIIVLLYLTFEWPQISGRSLDWWISPELFIWLGLTAIAVWFIRYLGKSIGYLNVLSKSYTFIAFLPLLFVGGYSEGLARVMTNLLILALGVYTIREGALENKLWKMNYGLLILSILIICRFFDTELSFVIRGLLFVGIGLGFFLMNYYAVRKRKPVPSP